jgi:hypothetical protein
MCVIERPLTSESDFRLYNQIRKMIQDEKSLLKVSICLGVKLTSLRRIKAGEPVSKYILEKVSAELKKGVDPSDFLFRSPVARKLLLVYQLYQEKGSLEKVGRIMNLSRERIRQLLEKGTELGLFEYRKLNKLPLPNVQKAKFMEDYKNLLSLKEVAEKNNISIAQIYKLLDFYHVGSEELDTIRIREKKSKCINQYFSIADRLGHPPSTRELQKTSEGNYLSFKILRLWGSIHIFRRELNIHFFPQYRGPLRRVLCDTI